MSTYLNSRVQELHSTVVGDQVPAVMVIPPFTSSALECYRVKKTCEIKHFSSYNILNYSNISMLPITLPIVYMYTHMNNLNRL